MTEESKCKRCEKHDECSVYNKLVKKKTFRLATPYKVYEDCHLEVGEYYNHHVSIKIYNNDGYSGTMTVNHDKLSEFDNNWVCIDVHNAPFLDALIKELGIGEFTGYRLMSGWMPYPVYKFDMEKVNEYTR